jgi:hypothetical protein
MGSFLHGNFEQCGNSGTTDAMDHCVSVGLRPYVKPVFCPARARMREFSEDLLVANDVNMT